MGHLYFSMILMAFLLFLGVSSDSTWGYRKTCRPGQAISNLKWRNGAFQKLDVKIECVNVTSSCNETCEWRPYCISPMANNTSTFWYVRGIDPLYDNTMKHYRPTFLCCKAEKDKKKRMTCQTKFSDVKSAFSNKNGRNIFIRDAMEQEEGQSIYVRTCTLNDTVHNLCSPAYMQSEVSTNEYLFGLAGLAGLSGLAGLALIKKTPQTMPSTPAPVCPGCCPQGEECENLCIGGFFLNDNCPMGPSCCLTDGPKF